MVGPQRLFANLQGALVKRLGLGVAPLDVVEFSPLVEALGDVGMLGPQRLFPNLQGAKIHHQVILIALLHNSRRVTNRSQPGWMLSNSHWLAHPPTACDSRVTLHRHALRRPCRRFQPCHSPELDGPKWVAISFSNAWKWKVKVKSLSRVLLLATTWTAAYQAPPSMGFSRQEYWSGVPLGEINSKETI